MMTELWYELTHKNQLPNKAMTPRFNELLEELSQPAPGKVCPEYYIVWGCAYQGDEIDLGTKIRLVDEHPFAVNVQNMDGDMISVYRCWLKDDEYEVNNMDWPVVESLENPGIYYPLELICVKCAEDSFAGFRDL